MIRRPPSSTLSLHDALPILALAVPQLRLSQTTVGPLSVAQGADTTSTVEAQNVGDGSLNLQVASSAAWLTAAAGARSEEHTSELQSRLHLVCRLLLEKKKKK